MTRAPLCHISPYKSDFASYTTLDPPVYLNAANQQRFPAIGTGTLSIRTPNGAAPSILTLHDVLHAPAVGYTLVSIGALDKKGYRMLRSDYAESVYHMSWNYHVIMMSLVPDYSTTFHTTSHSDSYYYRDY
jgi:hypothetical protein